MKKEKGNREWNKKRKGKEYGKGDAGYEDEMKEENVR